MVSGWYNEWSIICRRHEMTFEVETYLCGRGLDKSYVLELDEDDKVTDSQSQAFLSPVWL